MINNILNVITAKYKLTQIDTKNMSKLKASGMTFDIKAFYAEGLGHVSVMSAKGFFGLMKMDTLVVNPLEKDMPLYSYDRIYAMGNDTLIGEIYDTMTECISLDAVEEVNKKYAFIPDRDPGVHWYDTIRLSSSISKKDKTKNSEVMDKLAFEHFRAYFDIGYPDVVNKEAKIEKAAYYVNGLLKNGGPSTDAFIKSIGAEKTAELFHKVLFGV